MNDLFFLGLTTLFLALTLGLIHAIDRLRENKL
jgi:hypothetical protein